MTPEQLSALAQQAGATHYSPPPMRAVRGWSFTHEQLAAFAKVLAAQPALAADADPTPLNGIAANGFHGEGARAQWSGFPMADKPL